MTQRINQITERVIGAAITVHRALGPGLLESAYQAALAEEMRFLGIPFLAQVPLKLRYRTVDVDCAYKMDFVVHETVVLELKAVEKLIPIHEAQVLTYLKLSGLPLGLLMNFHQTRLVDGVIRLANADLSKLSL